MDEGVAATSMSNVIAPPTQSSNRLITGPFVSVTLTAFVFFFYIGMVLVTVPRFIEEELGYGEFGIGLAVASFAIAAVFARPFLGRLTERFGRRAMMMAGALIAAAAGAVMGLATELWHVLALRAVMGLGEAALFVAAATLIADLSPPNRRARSCQLFLGRGLRRDRDRSVTGRVGTRRRPVRLGISRRWRFRRVGGRHGARRPEPGRSFVGADGRCQAAAVPSRSAVARLWCWRRVSQRCRCSRPSFPSTLDRSVWPGRRVCSSCTARSACRCGCSAQRCPSDSVSNAWSRSRWSRWHPR